MKTMENSDAMNSDDADMMEAEASTARRFQLGEVAMSSDSNEVRNLLAMARQLVDQGKPSQALQAVVTAMRLRGGEEAVSQVLHRARQLYINKAQASAAAAELTSMFAECAIAEATPSEHEMYVCSVEPDPEGSSILAESGRKHIAVDALSDGSSFICSRCGGLISNHRKDEHFASWCSKI